MIKTFTLLTTYLAVSFAFSQSITFEDAQGNDLSGTTMTKTISCSDIQANGSLDVGMYGINIVNNSQGSMDIKVKRFETSVPGGTQNYFCWFVCYAAQNSGVFYEWPTPSHAQYNHKRTLTAGQVDTNFFAHHIPNGVCQSATYRYVAFDGNNTNDSAYIDIVFDVVTSADELEQNVVARAYPNPTSDFLNVSLEGVKGTANVVITNMLGAEVKAMNAVNGMNRISVQDLPNGVYFYSVRNTSGILLSKRFIVSK